VYNSRGVQEWSQSRVGMNALSAIPYFHAMIMDNVMNRQQQVKIAFTEHSHLNWLKEYYSSLFQGIHSLSVCFCKYPGDLNDSFPLHLLSSISHINISRNDYLTDLSGLNGNIISLETSDMPSLVDITHIKSLPTLEKWCLRKCNKLEIRKCHKYHELKGIEKINFLAIFVCGKVSSFSHLLKTNTNCEIQEFCLEECGLSFRMTSLKGIIQKGRKISKLNLTNCQKLHSLDDLFAYIEEVNRDGIDNNNENRNINSDSNIIINGNSKGRPKQR
jgi:hypothetical protein